MCGHHAVIACPKKPYRLPDTGPDLLLCVESVTSTSTVHHQGYQTAGGVQQEVGRSAAG